MHDRRRPKRLAKSIRAVPLLAVLLFALASLPAPASAQEDPALALGDGDELVDRVVAVVGDSVILQSEVQERILQLQAQGMDVPDDPQARRELQRELVDNLVDEQLMLQAAVQDTMIAVDEGQIDEIVAGELGQRARAFGGEAAMRSALQQQGMTMGAFREMLRADARRQQLQNQFLARHGQDLSGIRVTEEEMREFFEENRERLGSRPAAVTFKQIVLQPRAPDSVRERAREQAEELLERIRSGDADFEEVARRESDDPGTRQQGGDLGWFRRGQMVPAFEDAVFSLREGQVSDVVETRFGFHIVKVERIRSGERRARHILIRPETGDGSGDETRALAATLKDELERGASIDSLQEEYGDPDQPDSLTVPRDRLGQLPPGYEEALSDVDPGTVVGPVEWGSGENLNLAVLQVLDVREEGDFGFEDVRQQIRQRLQQQKLMERVVQDLREETYVEIRM